MPAFPAHPLSPAMSESARAVFLRYASQDAEAARRIAEALRVGGTQARSEIGPDLNSPGQSTWMICLDSPAVGPIPRSLPAGGGAKGDQGLPAGGGAKGDQGLPAGGG